MEGTGLVLAGGGGKGVYQIGVIKVLAEAGLLDDVTVVSGTSIGGVNAVLFAEGMMQGGVQHTITQMDEAWEDIDYNVFFNVDVDSIHSGDSHFSRNATEKLIDKYLEYSLFDTSKNDKVIPVYVTAAACPPGVVTTEHITDEEIKLLTSASVESTYADYTKEYMCLTDKSDEYIKNAILATTALPVIYNPVMVDGKLYVDGGVKDNTPIQPLYDLGIRRFIVIELGSQSAIRGVTSNKADIITAPDFPDAEIIDILPSHDLGKILSGTMNFDKEDKSIKKEIGVRDAKRYIKTLFEKDEAYIAVEKELAIRDYEDIINQNTFNKTYNKLDSSISSRFDYINDIENKYKDI